jgi:hypothetical protein
VRLPERQHNGKLEGKKLFALRTIIINVRALFALSLLPIGSIAFAAHEYDIALDENLTTMTVVARFDRAISYVSARSRYAGRYLQDAGSWPPGRLLLDGAASTVDAASGAVKENAADSMTAHHGFHLKERLGDSHAAVGLQVVNMCAQVCGLLGVGQFVGGCGLPCARPRFWHLGRSAFNAGGVASVTEPQVRTLAQSLPRISLDFALSEAHYQQ